MTCQNCEHLQETIRFLSEENEELKRDKAELIEGAKKSIHGLGLMTKSQVELNQLLSRMEDK